MRKLAWFLVAVGLTPTRVTRVYFLLGASAALLLASCSRQNAAEFTFTDDSLSNKPSPTLTVTPTAAPIILPSPTPTPTAPATTPTPTLTPTPAATVSARSVTVRPNAISTAFRNPGKGWVVYDYEPFSDRALENTPLASLVYSNFFSWGDLEPAEGVYDFSGIDRLFAKTLPGQKIGLAIVSIDPTSRPHRGAKGKGQTPYWLQAKMGTYAGRCLTTTAGLAISVDPTDPYQCVFSPYYWHPDFLLAHKKLIQALADRYGKPAPGQNDWRDRIELIEIASFGYWGEWHDTDQPWPNTTTQWMTTRAMVDDYFTAFQSYPEIRLEISGVVSRVAPDFAAGSTYDLTNIYHAIGKGAGITRKFLGANESLYLSQLESQLLQSYVPYRPIRLEWGSFTGNIFDFVESRDPNYRGYLHTAIERGLQFQTSYLGWHRNSDTIYCSPGEVTYNNCSTRENSALTKKQYDSLSMKTANGETLRESAQKRMGYRFELKQVTYPDRVSPGKTFSIETIWDQVAVAKLYSTIYDLKFWIALPDGRNYVLGQTPFTAYQWSLGVQRNRSIPITELKVPQTATAGVGKLMFAVVDKRGKPAMNLAIEGKENSDPNDYSSYYLGTIQIDPN